MIPDISRELSQLFEKDLIAICGFSRSGTTLLHQMLRCTAINAYVCPDETSAMNVRPRITKKTITKRPLDIYDLDKVKNQSKLNVIFVVRDIRDLLTSYHKDVQNDYFIGADYVYNTSRKIPFKTEYGSIIGTYEEFKKQSHKRKIHVIKYEDIVSKPNVVQETFKNEFGVIFSDRFSNYMDYSDKISLTKPLNGIRPPECSRIGKWKKDASHKKRVEEQFKKFPKLKDIMEYYNYV